MFGARIEGLRDSSCCSNAPCIESGTRVPRAGKTQNGLESSGNGLQRIDNISIKRKLPDSLRHPGL